MLSKRNPFFIRRYGRVGISLTLLFFLSFCASSISVDFFYVDKGVMKYFIRPSSFADRNLTAEIDFTYLSGKNVLCNFTLHGHTVPERVARVGFLPRNGAPIYLDSLSLLFSEPGKARYSALLREKEFKRLLGAKITDLSLEELGAVHYLKPRHSFHKRQKDARDIIGLP